MNDIYLIMWGIVFVAFVIADRYMNRPNNNLNSTI